MPADRDSSTGRYVHRWGWQGYDASGEQWESCEHCDLWKRTSDGHRTRKDPGELYDRP